MRIGLSIAFVSLIAALIVCAFLSAKSRKSAGKAVAILIISLIPPMFGNLFIISSPVQSLAMTGCYIYFIGMDFVMAALIRFTFDYCDFKHRALFKSVIYSILTLDAIQILLNLATGHVFGMELINVYNGDYWRFIPYAGQYVHRVVDYTILGGVVIAFIYKAVRSPRVYAERYLVVLLAMLAVAAWQSFYIISRTPMDVSMIGFGVFGLLVFILTIYYRPLKLLDRMLASIASKMPEALFFFDTAERCIWLNAKAISLLDVEENRLEEVAGRLKEKIGEFEEKGADWEDTITTGKGSDLTSYVVEKHNVFDARNKVVGFYVSVRDNSQEEQNLQEETYKALHDPLTNALNRAGFDKAMKDLDISKMFLLLIDLDAFKAANDEYGHNVGDQVLIKVVNTISSNFRSDDLVCRIGGDEFAVIIPKSDSGTPAFAKERIDQINKILKDESDKLPTISISAGGAFGKDAENAYELMNNADHAMYETKFNGKCGFTLFRKR